MNREEHWENVYRTRKPGEVSWYQAKATVSLQLIAESGISSGQSIIDVGGGASVLADDLLAADFRDITVLDISVEALAASRQRLGEKSAVVQWLQSDILHADLPEKRYDLWHDRAVFHFLTNEEDQAGYLRKMLHALRPMGQVVVATFAEDGPTRCSGLDVQRYSPDELQFKWRDQLKLVKSACCIHITPAGKEQKFQYCLFRRA